VSDLVSEVAEQVGLWLGVDHVTGSDRVIEDLGAESMDVVAIIAGLEDRYDISIDEERLPGLSTVEDLADEVATRLPPA
jgi:acyl carrier protein